MGGVCALNTENGYFITNEWQSPCETYKLWEITGLHI